MTDRAPLGGDTAPRVFSIPPGAPFLPTLAHALKAGTLSPGFDIAADPLALSRATIYLPTRRAVRAFRGVLADMADGQSAILPTVKALGEFDEDEAAFGEESSAMLDLAPAVGDLDRLLMLAPVVRAWKRQLPGHVAKLFEEEFVVPVSTADSLWLARDLARLMDDVETEQTDWAKLASLVSDDYAGWWQVTLKFLEIVTDYWPRRLIELGRSNPAAHRNALIGFEAERLRNNPPDGPVIAAGSTGSIPATADLLAVISRLPQGALVLPGLDLGMDTASWGAIDAEKPEPPVVGHAQFGLARLLRKLRVQRGDVVELAQPGPVMSVRARLVSDAMRPSETTDAWLARRSALAEPDVTEALASVAMIDAANERDEALAIAVALREAVTEPSRKAALVTADRNLARRVSSELLRFGIEADDSGGTPLATTAPAVLLRLLTRAVYDSSEPVVLLSLLKHPLLRLGLDRPAARAAAETVELVALRGGTGRPEIASLSQHFEDRLAGLAGDRRAGRWFAALTEQKILDARALLGSLGAAVAPLAALREAQSVDLVAQITATVRAFEALGRDEQGSVADLYAKDAGEQLASFLRALLASTAPFEFSPSEWPDFLDALIATETVKPKSGADRRVAIWGSLEARLQNVDTLVLGGLNEGTWPRRAEADRFLSRVMRSGIDLEPPERLIGLAAHDFEMAMGTRSLVLSRSARTGDAPAVASRWLQRLTTFAGADQAQAMRARGDLYLDWARQLDESEKAPFASRPNPTPPLEVRPKAFSVTEIETLRRDPYAIYARHVLKLAPLEPLIRDPNYAERGSLFHEILHRFSKSVQAPGDPAALGQLLEIGRACFDEAALPPEVDAVWWPRFRKIATGIIGWEAARRDVKVRHAEAWASQTPVGSTGVTLRGQADRIDELAAGMADILDYKTGSSPSKAQAHTLLSPQLALEGALLMRGAFRELGVLQPAELAYVRLKADGDVEGETILMLGSSIRAADDLSNEAWDRLDRLLTYYNDPSNGYLSRALPFREGDTDGVYDHLARVLEWSAGGEDNEGEA